MLPICWVCHRGHLHVDCSWDHCFWLSGWPRYLLWLPALVCTSSDTEFWEAMTYSFPEMWEEVMCVPLEQKIWGRDHGFLCLCLNLSRETSCPGTGSLGHAESGTRNRPMAGTAWREGAADRQKTHSQASEIGDCLFPLIYGSAGWHTFRAEWETASNIAQFLWFS